MYGLRYVPGAIFEVTNNFPYELHVVCVCVCVCVCVGGGG
jgi:hypothetical protein